MPVNLELKVLTPSLSEAEERARAHGALLLEDLRQTDTYFPVPHGRLKIREIEGQSSELIFYDRPETSLERRSTYLKESLPDGSGVKAILCAAFGVRAVIRKERRVFLFKGARIHLDRVDGIGTFLEFEVPVHEGVTPELLMRELRALFDVQERDILALSYADILEGSGIA